MLLFSVISLALPTFALAVCTLRDGDDITATIQNRGADVDIDVQNAKLTPGDWTSVAFGINMTDLEVYVFELKDGQVAAYSGHSTGYTPPVLDADKLVVRDSAFSNGGLNVKFTRPLKESGPRKNNLDSCVMATVSHGPMAPDHVGYHYKTPVQTRICLDECK